MSEISNRYKDCTGKSIERLEAEKAEKAALEGQARAQAQANCTLAKQLADAQDAAAVAQSLADAWANENTVLRNKAQALAAELAAAEARIVDLETVRRKLHNTIMVSEENSDKDFQILKRGQYPLLLRGCCAFWKKPDCSGCSCTPGVPFFATIVLLRNPFGFT